jgi:hypothetical protein
LAISYGWAFRDGEGICEAQKRRMADSVKTLAANYNAKRVHDECVTSTREAVASK